MVFFSDARVPHEVLPCNAERFAITHWFYDQNERDICLNEHGKADDLRIEQRRIEQEIAKFEREHGGTAEKNEGGVVGELGATAAPVRRTTANTLTDKMAKSVCQGYSECSAGVEPVAACSTTADTVCSTSTAGAPTVDSSSDAPFTLAPATPRPAAVTPPPSAGSEDEFSQTTSFSPSKAERDAAAAAVIEAENPKAQSRGLEVTLEALPNYGDHGGTRVQLIIPGLKTARDLEIESSADAQTLVITCEDPSVHLEQLIPCKFDVDGCTAKFRKRHSMLQVTCPHIADQ